MPTPSITTSPFSYADANAAPPAEYQCGTCGATDVRLWREYNTFLEHQRLYCAPCAIKDQTRPDTVECQCESRWCAFCKKHGKLNINLGDQIGWLVPAVPTEDGTTYWGYTSVPTAGVAWWARLAINLSSKEPFAGECIYKDCPRPARYGSIIFFGRNMLHRLRWCWRNNVLPKFTRQAPVCFFHYGLPHADKIRRNPKPAERRYAHG